MPEDSIISAQDIQPIMKKLKSKLNPSIISSSDIGCELQEELNKYNQIKLTHLLNWENSVSNIYKIIKGLLSSFNEVEITEYWGNTYQLKIPKSSNITIGYLFGYFDDIKESCSISDYSIGQTSMEQIFNSFANQEEDIENDNDNNNNKVKDLKERMVHKPVLKITSSVIEHNYNYSSN